MTIIKEEIERGLKIYNPEHIIAILPVGDFEPHGIVFRTSDGWLGIDIGDRCIAMSIKKWHELAASGFSEAREQKQASG